MKRKSTYAFLCSSAVAALLLTGSCGKYVFEDRSICPCYVCFDVQDGQNLPEDEDICIRIDAGASSVLLASDTTELVTMGQLPYHLEVRKTDEAVVYGGAGFVNSRANGSRWSVQVGSNADSLYRFVSTVDASGEEVTAPVRMTKEHSKVTVRCVTENGLFPYIIKVAGNTCGLDMKTGEPVRGEFLYEPEEEAPGVFRFIAPRQGDHSLVLQMWAKPGMTDEEGHIDDLLLWSILSGIEGFSWEMENLPDIDIELDYVRSRLTVTVGDWVTGGVIDFEI